MIRALFFDWGNTVMEDFSLPGPMAHWDRVAWVPGAEAALQVLSVKYPCYMASNAPLSDEKMVLKALERVGADIYFRKIFSSSDIGLEKPHPGFFRALFHDLPFEPHETVMIGDSYLKDIEGAKDAGMKTVFLNRNSLAGDFVKADFQIRNMSDLHETIEKFQ